MILTLPFLKMYCFGVYWPKSHYILSNHLIFIYYEYLVVENNPPVKLKKYKDAEQCILMVVRDYNNRNMVEYLRGITHNYKINL